MNNRFDSVLGVIVAGGEGKRFRPLTNYVPKPLIPVGRSEKPIMEYIVRWFARHGIRDVIALIGYKWRQIVNYFGDGSRFGVRLRYSVDKAPYRDTGGALKRIFDLGLVKGYNDLLIWYGDILASLNITDLLMYHQTRGFDATLAVSPRYQVPVGVAEINDGKIISLKEKPHVDINATIGIAAFNASSLRKLMPHLSTEFDIMAHLIPKMLEEELSIGAYIYRGEWYDIGSIERYEKIDHDNIDKMMMTDMEDHKNVY